MTIENVAGNAGANADVRVDAGAGTTLSAEQAAAGAPATTNTGQAATPPAQTGADAGDQGTAPPQAAAGAAGQEAAPERPLRGPLAAAAQTPSPAAADGAQASWPDDWREKAAAGDPDVAKTIERYGDPAAVAKALAHAQRQLRAGVKPEAPGADATPEEKAAYAELTGVPPAPDAYKIELQEGRLVGEHDKPFVDAFLARAHTAGMTNEQASAAVDFWAEVEGKIVAQQQQADVTYGQESTEQLKESWGRDFDGNLTRINNLLAAAPDGFQQMLFRARTPEGRLMGDSPEVLSWLLDRARDESPSPSTMGRGTVDMKGLQTRKTELQTLMQDDKSEYYRGPKSQGLRDEYLQIVRDEQRYGQAAKA